jgi:hypothetical protein
MSYLSLEFNLEGDKYKNVFMRVLYGIFGYMNVLMSSGDRNVLLDSNIVEFTSLCLFEKAVFDYN